MNFKNSTNNQDATYVSRRKHRRNRTPGEPTEDGTRGMDSKSKKIVKQQQPPKEGSWSYSGTRCRVYEEDMGYGEPGSCLPELYYFGTGESNSGCANASRHGGIIGNATIKSHGPIPNREPACHLVVGLRADAFCERCRSEGPIRELTRLGRYFEIPIPVPTGYIIERGGLRIAGDVSSGVQPTRDRLGEILPIRRPSPWRPHWDTDSRIENLHGRWIEDGESGRSRFHYWDQYADGHENVYDPWFNTTNGNCIDDYLSHQDLHNIMVPKELADMMDL